MNLAYWQKMQHPLRAKLSQHTVGHGKRVSFDRTHSHWSKLISVALLTNEWERLHSEKQTKYSWKQFHFEMFAVLLQFLDEYPTIYLIVICLQLLLWMCFVHVEFFASDADENRLDICLKACNRTRKIPNDLNIAKEIQWIKGKVDFHSLYRLATVLKCKNYLNICMCICVYLASIECNRFSTNIETNSAEKLFMGTPLTWNGFENSPIRILLENTGHDGNCMQMTGISFPSALA